MAKKLNGLSEVEVIQLIGSIIDIGGDEQSIAALNHANHLLDVFLAGNPTKHHICRVHYFRANIWSAKRRTSPAWVWESELIDSEISELRKALVYPGFADLHPLSRHKSIRISVTFLTTLNDLLKQLSTGIALWQPFLNSQ